MIDALKANFTLIDLRGSANSDKKGLGTTVPHDLGKEDNEYDAYRKRMMLAYRFRPNPLVRNERCVLVFTKNPLNFQTKKNILLLFTYKVSSFYCQTKCVPFLV